MDELINHLMHNPENTNPNVIRDMLKSSNISGEPNLQITEISAAQRNGKYYMVFDEFEALFLAVDFITGKIHGFIDNNKYDSYMGDSYSLMRITEEDLSSYNFNYVSTLKSVNELAADLLQNLSSAEIFVPKKECSVTLQTITLPHTIVIEEEEFYDNFTSIGTV